MAKKKSKEKRDYSETSWKMDKYMPNDSEIQDEYYTILDDGDADELVDFFEANMNDEERFESLLPKGGTLKGFCKYLIKQHNK
jgi:hypothetical protein